MACSFTYFSLETSLVFEITSMVLKEENENKQTTPLLLPTNKRKKSVNLLHNLQQTWQEDSCPSHTICGDEELLFMRREYII